MDNFYPTTSHPASHITADSTFPGVHFDCVANSKFYKVYSIKLQKPWERLWGCHYIENGNKFCVCTFLANMIHQFAFKNTIFFLQFSVFLLKWIMSKISPKPPFALAQLSMNSAMNSSLSGGVIKLLVKH